MAFQRSILGFGAFLEDYGQKDTASQPVDGHEDYQGLQGFVPSAQQRNDGAADKTYDRYNSVLHFSPSFKKEYKKGMVSRKYQPSPVVLIYTSLEVYILNFTYHRFLFLLSS